MQPDFPIGWFYFLRLRRVYIRRDDYETDDQAMLAAEEANAFFRMRVRIVPRGLPHGGKIQFPKDSKPVRN